MCSVVCEFLNWEQQNTRMCAASRAFWLEFLELYENLPALWRIKSEEYTIRQLKDCAYAVLVEKLQEVEPNADKEMVRKKINSFRTNYRKELRKIRYTGNGAKSSLWYFDALSFLEDQSDGPERMPRISEDSRENAIMFKMDEPQQQELRLKIKEEQKDDDDEVEAFDEEEEEPLHSTMGHRNGNNNSTSSTRDCSSQYDQFSGGPYYGKTSEARKAFWLDFLELYKNLPALWKIRSEAYTNRELKNSAYNVLIAKLQEIEPTADKEMVKKKINSFRSNYRKSLRKLNERKKSGAGSMCVIESPLWYFDALSFLEDRTYNSDGRTRIYEDSNDTPNTIDDSPNIPTMLLKEEVIPEVMEIEDEEENEDDEEELHPVTYMHQTYTNNDSTTLTKGWTSQQCDRFPNGQFINARKRFWLEFLDMYKHMPTLWRVGSEDYTNKELKETAYIMLTEKLREVEPTADKEMVKNKINSFRTNYRKRLKILDEQRKGNASALNPLEAPLWYFDALSFLEDRCYDVEVKTRISEDSSDTATMYDEPPRKKKKSMKEEDYQTPYGHYKANESESTILAKGWAAQYDKMSSVQQHLARKIISDVFFYGGLEQLTENAAAGFQQSLTFKNLSPFSMKRQ